MLIERLSQKKFAFVFCMLFFLFVIMFSFMSCNSPESSEVVDDTETADINITNDYGETLDIYFDGAFQFSIANNETDVIEDVTLEVHLLTAFRANTTTQVDSTELDVSSGGSYSWVIDDPADINVQNYSGYTLTIYMDNNLMFDIVDEENRWIMNVSYTEHLLKAVITATGVDYASITIDVTENTDYSWSID